MEAKKTDKVPRPVSSWPTVRINPENYEKLIKIVADRMVKSGKMVSLVDLANELLKKQLGSKNP